MPKTRSWDEIYNNLDSLTQEDRDEIDVQVRLVGEILDACREKGLTQAEFDAARQISDILKILRPLGKTLAVVDAPPRAVE